MPFDEDIDPLTGNRKVHKHNAEKSKTPTSKISINPKLTIEQSHEYEDLLVQNIRHKSKELGIKLGNRNKVGFGSTIPITLGKETGFIIISFSSTRYNDDKSNFMAYRKNIIKSGKRSWEEIKKVSLNSISDYHKQVDIIIKSINPNNLSKDELTLVKTIKLWFEEGAWDEDTPSDMLGNIDETLELAPTDDEDSEEYEEWFYHGNSYAGNPETYQATLQKIISSKQIKGEEQQVVLETIAEGMQRNLQNVIDGIEKGSNFFDEDVMLYNVIESQTKSKDKQLKILKNLKEISINWNH